MVRGKMVFWGNEGRAITERRKLKRREQKQKRPMRKREREEFL
jgi:hypothetical protein